MGGDGMNTLGVDNSASPIMTRSAAAAATVADMLIPSTSHGVAKDDTVTGRRPNDREAEDAARDAQSGSNVIGRMGTRKKGRHKEENFEPESPLSEDG